MRGNFLGQDKSIHIHVLEKSGKSGSNQVEISMFFLFFFFFCRLVLKCFIYREMVNVNDHKLSEIFLNVGLAEPIKFVLRSVIYIFIDSLRHVKFS